MAATDWTSRDEKGSETVTDDRGRRWTVPASAVYTGHVDGHRVTLRLRTIAGRTRVEAVLVEATEAVGWTVKARTLRNNVPLSDLVYRWQEATRRRATGRYSTTIVVDPHAPVTPAVEAAVSIYLTWVDEHAGSRHGASRAVADRLGINPSTARNLIQQARKAGRLAPYVTPAAQARYDREVADDLARVEAEAAEARTWPRPGIEGQRIGLRLSEQSPNITERGEGQ